MPAVEAKFGPYPDGHRRPADRGARGARDRAALHASEPRRSRTSSAAATSSPSRRRRRARRSATTRRSERDPAGSVDARAVSLSDQGARPGPAGGAARAVAAGHAASTDTEIGVFTYDGDTPSDARRAIRGKAHVVLSNPDMVHSGILPHHPRWAKLFENLRYVIIDELHAYRGVFGSHLVEHPAPPAAHLPALRLGSDLHLLVGDDCESEGAGRRADRPSRSSWSRRAARRAARSSSSS